MKTSSLDDIHDLRVTTRRFRAVLDLFGSIVPKEPLIETRKTISRLTRKLGGLRNIDEAIVFFQSRIGINSPTDNQLGIKLSRLRSREIKQIFKTLKTFDHRKSNKRVRKIVAGMNGGPVKDSNQFSLPAYFSDASIRLYQPIQHLLAASTLPEHHKDRHKLRIAIKKLRYFFEIISQVFERDYILVLEHLKEYQSILGSMNDIIEFDALVRKLKLPKTDRNAAAAALKAENDILMKRYTKLVENKPLAYTFIL